MCNANCITWIYLFHLAAQDKGKRDFAILNACLFLRAQKTHSLPVCVGEGVSCKPGDLVRGCILASLGRKVGFLSFAWAALFTFGSCASLELDRLLCNFGVAQTTLSA